MTRRMIARRAFDATHGKLMLEYHRARGGDRIRKLRALQDYVTGSLKSSHPSRTASQEGAQ